MSLTSTHNYNTRSSNDATNRINFTTVSSESDTATLDPLANLESKLLARFDAVQSELLNVKSIIIKICERRMNGCGKKFLNWIRKLYLSNQDITCSNNMGEGITLR